jgi:hypothetical protein
MDLPQDLLLTLLRRLSPQDRGSFATVHPAIARGVEEAEPLLSREWLAAATTQALALEDDHAETDAELLRVFRAVEGVAVEASKRRAVLRASARARAFSWGVVECLKTAQHDGIAEDLFVSLRAAAAAADAARIEALLGICEPGQRATLLRDAVLAGDLTLCEALVEHGADANDGSVIVAAYAGKHDIARFLASKANVDAWIAFDPFLSEVLDAEA